MWDGAAPPASGEGLWAAKEALADITSADFGILMRTLRSAETPPPTPRVARNIMHCERAWNSYSFGFAAYHGSACETYRKTSHAPLVS